MASEQEEVPLLLAKSRADDASGSTVAGPPRLVLTALGLAVGICTVIGLGGYGLANGLPYLKRAADEQSPQQRIDRQKAFGAIGEVVLPLVKEVDLPMAIQTMALPAESKAQLIAGQQQADSPTSQPQTTPAAVPGSQEQAHARPEPAIQVTKPRERTQLAWLTLWDTDDEDGDIVRIDSGGYSRVIYLTKVPVAYAVPIAVQGSLTITGLKDGEGGGITVGVMTGNLPIPLPIMSTGQTLAIHVRGK